MAGFQVRDLRDSRGLIYVQGLGQLQGGYSATSADSAFFSPLQDTNRSHRSCKACGKPGKRSAGIKGASPFLGLESEDFEFFVSEWFYYPRNLP